MALESIVKALPQRTPWAVEARIYHLVRQGRIERREGDLRAPWTAREVAILVDLRSRGATLDEITRKLPNRTRPAIEKRAARLIGAGTLEPRGPKTRRPWTPKEDAKLDQLRRRGRTQQQIARALGRTVPSVNGRIAERARKAELEPPE